MIWCDNLHPGFVKIKHKIKILICITESHINIDHGLRALLVPISCLWKSEKLSSSGGIASETTCPGFLITGGRDKRQVSAVKPEHLWVPLFQGTCVKCLLFSHLATLLASVKDFGNKSHVLVCVKTSLSFCFVAFRYHWMFPSFFFSWKNELRNFWFELSLPWWYILFQSFLVLISSKNECFQCLLKKAQ